VVAHELRQPLAALTVAVEILAHNADPTAARAKDTARRQLAQLARLVHDLGEVSRLARQKLTLERDVIDVFAALDEAVEGVRPDIQRRRQQLLYPGRGPVTMIDGDHARLRQVFSNLLENATKFTDPGGSITIETCVTSGEVIVSIGDTGRGIAEEDLPFIFELFVQSRNGEHRGLGIGLYVARAVTELHGGRIEVESAGGGEGTTFRVILPLQPGR
jgi:signal transduction histidine kinase